MGRTKRCWQRRDHPNRAAPLCDPKPHRLSAPKRRRERRLPSLRKHSADATAGRTFFLYSSTPAPPRLYEAEHGPSPASRLFPRSQGLAGRRGALRAAGPGPSLCPAFKRAERAPDRGAGPSPAPLLGSTSAGYRRREDAGHTDPLGVAGLARDRREGHDPGLLQFHDLLDDALLVRGLRAEVDLRAFDPDPVAADGCAVLGQVDRQRGLAPDEQLLRGDLADRDAEH